MMWLPKTTLRTDPLFHTRRNSSAHTIPVLLHALKAEVFYLIETYRTTRKNKRNLTYNRYRILRCHDHRCLWHTHNGNVVTCKIDLTLEIKHSKHGKLFCSKLTAKSPSIWVWCWTAIIYGAVSLPSDDGSRTDKVSDWFSQTGISTALSLLQQFDTVGWRRKGHPTQKNLLPTYTNSQKWSRLIPQKPFHLQ